MGILFREYIRTLEAEAAVADDATIPDVVLEIFEDVIQEHDVCELRKFQYRIIDDSTPPAFEKVVYVS